MSALGVDNGYRIPLPGLGRNRALLNLSNKRISKTVREALREHYGHRNVTVGCEPERSSNGWHGSCTIHGEQFNYAIAE